MLPKGFFPAESQAYGQKWVYLLPVLLLLQLLFLSCQSEPSAGCLRGIGSEQSETRQLQPFHTLIVSDKIDVVLHQDSTQNFRCMLTGGENLLTGIRTDVKDGILRIEDGNTCNWVRNLQNRTRLDLWVSDLSRIELNGMSKLQTPQRIRLGDVQVDFISSADQNWNLDLNQLILNHSGVGEIQLEGHAAVYVLTLYFVAGADARHLESDFAFVYSYSTADAWVQPVKGLGVFIYDQGNVYFTREPWEQIVYEKKGNGERVYRPGI
jgi:hypothetical protein